jgi:crotonobetainyl-CoA:carnitine CoA-transferase CaiB-like acyl-CoA transferase
VFVDLLEQWSGTLTTQACQEAFDAAGVPSSPYRTVKNVLDDPQLAHRGALAQVHDKSGSFNVVNPPFRFSALPVQVSGFVASLGEHTRQVLEAAGYSVDQIEAMVRERVIGHN